jgi:hypothetical protein
MYELQGDYHYGDGYECLCAEDTIEEARERLGEYNANERPYLDHAVTYRIKWVADEGEK